MDAQASASRVTVRLDRRDWILLVITLPIIAILALGSHDLAIAHLGIPYPTWKLPMWVNAAGQASRIAGALLLYRCANRFFHTRSLVSAALAIGFLMVFLQETLRVTCVDIAITEGWVDGRWKYILINHLPGEILPLIQAAAAVLIGRFFLGRKLPVLAVLLVCAAGAVMAVYVSPALNAIPPALFERFSLTEPQELYEMPFTWHMYRVIYPTFIEPTIASFILAMLAWPGLRGGEGMKIAQFTAVILLVRGRIAGMVLNTLWIELPYPTALLSFGQFFVETLIMAALTGWVWSRIAARNE